MKYAFKRFRLKSNRCHPAARTLKTHVIRAFVLLGLLAGASPVFANDEAACKATVRTSGSVEQGLVFEANDFLDSMAPRDAVQRLADLFQGQGFPVSPLREDGTKVLADISPRPNNKDDATVLVYADSLFKQMYMIVKVPPGLARNGETVGDGMCKTFAYVAADDRRAKIPKVDPRTAPPPDVPSQNVLRPTATFDVTAAKAALEEGSATIRGTACVFHAVAGGGGGLYLASNQAIALYPDSAYLEEWVKLMHKAKPGRDVLDTDAQFTATRLVGKANSKGEFQFSRLKPGKYYLFATMSTEATGSRDVMLGSAQTDAQTITEYHTTEHFSVQNTDLLDKFVTVAEGQEAKITLTPPMSWKALIGKDNGSAGIFGCHTL